MKIKKNQTLNKQVQDLVTSQANSIKDLEKN